MRKVRWKSENVTKQLKQCAKIVQSLQCRIKPLFAMGFVFIRKFVVVTKNLKTNYTFFVKPTCFLLIQETRRLMTNVRLW